MADVTPILINQLAAQTTLADSDYFIVGGADAKKITVAQMKEALGINALNGNTSVENIPSQLTNLGYNGTAAVRKKGNQVIFSFELGYGQRQEVGEQQTIFTIPEGYRPNRSLTKFWLTTDGSDTLGYFWRILPDGRITLQSQTAIAGKNAWMVDYFVWNI